MREGVVVYDVPVGRYGIKTELHLRARGGGTLNDKTRVFLDAVKASKCMNDDDAEVAAEVLLDRIEESVADAMTLRRLYRHAARSEEDDELASHIHGYESELGALDRDGGKLLQALETFRTTISHMKRADRRIREEIEAREDEVEEPDEVAP